MFDSKLIARAKELFPTVFVEDDRVRIYPTDWFFETEDTIHNNAELEAYITAEEEAIAFENFMLDGALDD